MTLLLKKEMPFDWTTKQQNAFEQLKTKLITAPILRYPYFSQSFIIYTDASDTGLGTVLAQKDEDSKERVIAYASKSLNKAEQNYGLLNTFNTILD